MGNVEKGATVQTNPISVRGWREGVRTIQDLFRSPAREDRVVLAPRNEVPTSAAAQIEQPPPSSGAVPQVGPQVIPQGAPQVASKELPAPVTPSIQKEAATPWEPSPPARAEYAIRWDPADGGPKSAAQALAKLGPASDDKDSFDVRYPILSAPPPDLPTGFKAIVREREKTGANKKKYQLTYKHRGQAPLPVSPSLAQWHCPVGESDEKKDEVDVSFRGLADVARAYSRSCTVESENAPPVIPEELKARPAECKSTVKRLKGGGLTVEEWHLATGRTIIEVSQPGAATDQDLKAFRIRIAKVLVEKHKIKPIQSSMTELASACGN